MKHQRKKIWIDRFQTHLSLRIALYFVLYQAAVWAFVLIEGQIHRGLTALIGEGPASTFLLFFALTVVFVGGLFIWDAVHFAHRFVGPLYRFRKIVKAVAAGEEVDLVRLRQGDFLQDFRDDFNEMLRVLEQRGAVTLRPEQAQKEQAKPVSV
jgi:hypothetical protein